MPQNHWPVQRVPLHPPPLDEVAAAIRNGLQSNFSTSSCLVSVPPDVRQSPFHLAGSGLSGNPRVADVGGQRNLFPSFNRDKRYDLLRISELMEMRSGALIGAGAGPFFDLGLNIELMPNIAFGPGPDREVRNCTRYAKVLDDGSAKCEKIGTSTGCAIMCNLFGSRWGNGTAAVYQGERQARKAELHGGYSNGPCRCLR